MVTLLSVLAVIVVGFAAMLVWAMLLLMWFLSEHEDSWTSGG
jgi:hypothetical protein